MTSPRTSNVSTTTPTPTIPPATPIVRDAGTLLLKKVHAIRPMLTDRENRKKLDAIPAI
jgi:hypothetical protein